MNQSVTGDTELQSHPHVAVRGKQALCRLLARGGGAPTRPCLDSVMVRPTLKSEVWGAGVGDVGVNIFVWLSVGSVNEHLRDSS